MPFSISFISIQCFQFFLTFCSFFVNLLLMFHQNQVDSFSILQLYKYWWHRMCLCCQSRRFLGAFFPQYNLLLQPLFRHHLRVCCCFLPVHYINLMCGATFPVHLRCGWVLLNITARTHLHSRTVYCHVHFLYTKIANARCGSRGV